MSRIEILDKADPADAQAFEAWWAQNKDRWLGLKVCAAAAWLAALQYSDALRQHATPLEIGRGIGREEAAKIADGWLQQFRDRKIDFVRAEKFASDADADIRDLIRAAPLALDVEALVERVAAIIEPSMEQPASGAAQRVARAVIAALGVGE